MSISETPAIRTAPVEALADAPAAPVTEAAVVEKKAAVPLYESFKPKYLHSKNLDWAVIGWMTLMHAGAIAAPFFFSWDGLAICLFFYWFTGSIGICLGYHRFLSHKSMRLRTPARFFTLLAGVLSGQGSPLFWSATHRLHHQRSDQEGDPHSPRDGNWWSHINWLFVGRSKNQKALVMMRYVPDLVKDPMLQFFERTYGLWLLGSGVALFGIGQLVNGHGLSWLLWGLCFRMVITYHSTWFVNSATHIWGYRTYETRDDSKNLWWVALLTHGEGWHNNHHAHPHVAPAGHRWWEIDTTWWVIKMLRATGLAYDVDDRIPKPHSAAADGA